MGAIQSTVEKQHPAVLISASLVVGTALGLGLQKKYRIVQSIFGTGKGAFGGINRPTAGARTEGELPRGKHAIQLYSLATPNGVKVTCMLEELGIPYDAWPINILKGDQFTTGFVAMNPNSKVPSMIDYSGAAGESSATNLFESGSILLYLAEKYGKLLPTDPNQRVQCINWLFCQMGLGPYIGQFGHFYKYAPERIDYALERYEMELKRILDLLDKQLAGKQFLVGDEYTIADIAWFPWIRCIRTGYDAWAYLGVDNYKNVVSWLERCESRPASVRGIVINKTWGDDGVPEFHSP